MTIPDWLKGADLCIEPHQGATYGPRDGARFGVYAYDIYGPTSVLAGQERRRFVDAYDTVDAALDDWPSATVLEGSRYQPPYLGHLPDGPDL